MSGIKGASSQNKKDTRITVRLDRDSIKKLDENAKRYNETRVSSLRRSIDCLNQQLHLQDN